MDTRDAYGIHAAALLYHMIDPDPERTMYPTYPQHKASAYTEAPNPQGVAFYRNWGFSHDTTIAPDAITDVFGDSTIQYVRMVAEQAAVPQRLLRIALETHQ